MPSLLLRALDSDLFRELSCASKLTIVAAVVTRWLGFPWLLAILRPGVGLAQNPFGLRSELDLFNSRLPPIFGGHGATMPLRLLGTD